MILVLHSIKRKEAGTTGVWARAIRERGPRKGQEEESRRARSRGKEEGWGVGAL